MFITAHLDIYHYSAVIIDLKTRHFYNALFEGHTIDGVARYYLSQIGEHISLKQLRKLADNSEDSRAKKCQCSRSIEGQKLEDSRYQAQQVFQRGGLEREEAYVAYGLDPDGN